MSGYSPWKTLERRHAKRMGGVRLWRPDYSDSQPDGMTLTDTWDAKSRAAFEIHSIFQVCEKKYRTFTGDRRFHLVLFSRRHPRVGDLVVLRAEDYANLVADLEAARRAEKHVARAHRDAEAELKAVKNEDPAV